jgi:hypothetical protein
MGVEDQRPSRGIAIAFVALGALVAVLAIAIQVWGFLIMGVVFAGSGVITLAKQRVGGLGAQTSPRQWKPTAMVAPIIAAIAFWVWGLATSNPLALFFAVLWSFVAFAQIWRATHGGEPLVKR